eukprot:jgi/Picsp_1/4283/NSC_01792-R1_polysaccharide lyase family 14 protein
MNNALFGCKSAAVPAAVPAAAPTSNSGYKAFGKEKNRYSNELSKFTTLPVTGEPWKIGNPVWNTWLAEFASRFSTTKNDKHLKLTFARRNVSLESGARFVSSPTAILPSEELTFRYKVYFGKGFNFVISGKLPGIYLGTFQEGYSTGKVYNDGQGSFRPTWQKQKGDKNPNIAPYLYGAHGSNENARQAQGPKTTATISGGGPAIHFWMYGDSILPLKQGWNKIEIALKLNTPGVADGKVRMRVNGRTNTLDDVSFRDRKETKIQSIAMECFFGGSSKYHMTPGYKQTTKFKDIKLRPKF